MKTIIVAFWVLLALSIGVPAHGQGIDEWKTLNHEVESLEQQNCPILIPITLG
jgi:hypothetical protein